MADPLASVSDVEDAYGAIGDDLGARVDQLLRVASSAARQKVPGLDGNITAGTVDAQVVAAVIGEVVARALRNRAGVKSQTTGPFSVSYDDRVAAGFVYFTDDEVLLLGGSVASTGGGRLRTVRVGLTW